MYGDQPISHGGYSNGPEPPTMDRDRSVDYAHSTFADLVIEGLVGMRPSFDDKTFFTLHPLAGGSAIKYFVLDNVQYHSHNVTIAWDEDGAKALPGCKKGLCVWVDGEIRATSSALATLKVQLQNKEEGV
jgi:hypothetical protein